jgi:tetratricopeptide (TPR) repeat protein
LLLAVAGFALADKPLTEEQKAKLKERDRLTKEAYELGAAAKLDEMAAVWEKKLAIERAVFGEVHEEVAASLAELGRMHESREDFDAARKARKEVLALRTKLHGEKDWRVTNARVELEVLEQLAQLDTKDRRRFLEANESAQQAARLFEQGRARAAVPLARAALQVRREFLSGNHPAFGSSLSCLGMLYHDMGEYAKAQPLLEQARDLWKKLLTENHPDYAHSLNNLGMLYHATGDFRMALALFEEASDCYKQSLGENHAYYANSLNNLAALYHAMGDYNRALTLFERSRDLRRKLLGENDLAYANSLNNLAALYHDMGDHNKALTLYERARDLRRELLGENHPDYAKSLNNLAGLYMNMGDYNTALTLYEQARVLPWQNPDAAGARLAALIWQPLTKHLGNARTVLLAPDGPLAFVPFAALPGSKPDTYLLEDVTLGYVTSGRHLLELAADAADRPASAGLLALGGLDYGPQPERLKGVLLAKATRGMEYAADINPNLFLPASRCPARVSRPRASSEPIATAFVRAARRSC